MLFTASRRIFVGDLKVQWGEEKHQTFFFVSFEQFRETTIVNNQFQTIPTAAYRNGDFGTAVTSRLIGVDPAGNWRLAQTYQNNGNTNAGFGRVTTTGPTAFGTTANLLPRQGSLVARFTF